MKFEAIKILAAQGQLCFQLTVVKKCVIYEDDPDLDNIFNKSCFPNDTFHTTSFHSVPLKPSLTSSSNLTISSNLVSYFLIYTLLAAISQPISSPLAPSIENSTPTNPIALQISKISTAIIVSSRVTVKGKSKARSTSIVVA